MRTRTTHSWIVVVAVSLVACGDNAKLAVDGSIEVDAPGTVQGPCWPDDGIAPKGWATLGTGRDAFEPMPQMLPIEYGSQDGFDLVPGGATVLDLELGIRHDRADDQVRRGAVGAAAVVVVTARAAAADGVGVTWAGAATAAVVVTRLFAVAAMVIAWLFLTMTAAVIARLFLSVALVIARGGDVRRVLVLALDPGPVGDQAADGFFVEKQDRQPAGVGIE